MKISCVAAFATCFGILVHSATSFAECAKDSIGTVYCSEYPTGGAVADSIGTVQCGKGQCRKDSIGTVHCSQVPGGGAATDSIGSVKCLGGCERASRSMCVMGQG
jgi:hypothetical protein